MNKTVLVDIDDTLADTQVKILEYINSTDKSKYTIEDITPDFRAGKNAEYEELVKKFLSSSKLVSKILPFKDSLEAMKKLHQSGYEIHIVSSRKENLHSTTVEWLKRHHFFEHISRIHPRPSLLRGHLFKLDVASKIKPVAGFDDTLEVVHELVQTVPKLYLINKPWNQSNIKHNQIIRVNSFSQAVDMFLKSKGSY